ncbi:MAG TPA: AI-2E family transporter, partial [Candidatus Sulfotelmatobacter sp.]|nr:AI-2E family transporter [Candidatus Sulfotelmatobacter sp.]
MSAIEQPETQFERTETTRIVSERPRIETICLVFISLVAAVFILRYAQAIFLPFVLSLLLFYALDPVVSWISCFGIPRIVSCLLLVFAFLGTGASGAYLLRGQASDLVNRLPEAMRKAKVAIESHRNGQPGTVANVRKAEGELEKTASEAAGSRPSAGVTRVQIEEPIFKTSDYLRSGSIGVVGFIGQAVTVLFLIIF